MFSCPHDRRIAPFQRTTLPSGPRLRSHSLSVSVTDFPGGRVVRYQVPFLYTASTSALTATFNAAESNARRAW